MHGIKGKQMYAADIGKQGCAPDTVDRTVPLTTCCQRNRPRDNLVDECVVHAGVIVPVFSRVFKCDVYVFALFDRDYGME